MSNIPESLYYTEEHEYVKPSEDPTIVVVGITDYAQGELGDVVYVELPAVGETFDRMASFGTIEAVKAVSELYSPVEGEVVEVNDALEGDPALINRDPYGDGWMIKMALKDPGVLGSLLTATDYAAHVGE
jgi:glycine cleavage system H protein